ncbi:MAG: hydantoinase/carbamoylase family amidase, partial [Pseudomonadota bacterium]
AQGLSFGAELERIGWRGEEEVGARQMHTFFELHIEQGPILEAEGLDVGIVTHGQGTRWVQCTITGRESHTGSTPMGMRRNAGRGLAQITELVHEIAMSHQPDAVGAIGHIDVYPNSRNIIAGQVVCTIDFRSHRQEVLDAMLARFEATAPELCEALGLSLETEIVSAFDPPEFDAGCVAALRTAAQTLGYSHRDIVSGAGHDACWINKVVPTAMVMCPCVDGLSHNEAEEITKDWAAAGTNVLMHAVLDTAQVVA